VGMATISANPLADGDRRREMPPVASTWEDFQRLMRGRGLADLQAVA
jgi:hypothetical protein